MSGRSGSTVHRLFLTEGALGRSGARAINRIRQRGGDANAAADVSRGPLLRLMSLQSAYLGRIPRRFGFLADRGEPGLCVPVQALGAVIVVEQRKTGSLQVVSRGVILHEITETLTLPAFSVPPGV